VPISPAVCAETRAAGQNLVCSLRLPADQPDYLTEIGKLQPRYWELEVRGEAEDGVFEALFLLPVYLPPSAAVEAKAPALATQSTQSG
jgi:hypothetical protein